MTTRETVATKNLKEFLKPKSKLDVGLKFTPTKVTKRGGGGNSRVQEEKDHKKKSIFSLKSDIKVRKIRETFEVLNW